MRLVLVPCHAVCVTPEADDPADDAAWALQTFQHGEPSFYIEHIRRAVEVAAQATEARLIFSGGMTRAEAGPVSEAESYFRVAERFDWWGFPEVSERAETEDFARDSFENLLFGLFRFRELTGTLPDWVTVVGWGFKCERFDLHRAAIGFPAETFEYLGVNDPADLAGALVGEAKTIELFRADPCGETGVLAEKRRQRNPFNRTPPYPVSLSGLHFLPQREGKG
jgi:hypothetical protein